MVYLAVYGCHFFMSLGCCCLGADVKET